MTEQIAPENPYAAFGLNPDGSAKEEKKAPEGVAPDAILAKITGMENQLRKLEADQAPLTEKAQILDRLRDSLAGKTAVDPNSESYGKLFGEMKDVFRVASPALYKLLTSVEKDPDLLDRLQKNQDALAGGHAASLNTAAHTSIMNAAKSVFKGYTADELAEAVLPFENTITQMINANSEAKARFLSGDVDVAVTMFNRLVKPHVSARVRSKQAAVSRNPFPTATPRGAGGTSEQSSTPEGSLVHAKGSDGKAMFNIHTPAGKQAFARAAVERHLNRAARDE